MALKDTDGYLSVISAIVGNTVVTALKFTAAIFSGSSSMFAESVHSFADTLNQLLLLIGLRRSLKKRDDASNYGYGNERFFWGLISACGIFFVGAGITAWHAFETLTKGGSIAFTPLIFVVLAISFCIEFLTFTIAARQLKKKYPRRSWKDRIKKADSSTLAVLLEDAVAVLGVLVAATGITLSYITKNAFWDTLGSFFIAGMLGTVAVILIVKNRSYLVGHSIPDDVREGIIELVEKDAAIEKVIDFKSNSLGYSVFRIKCEVEFNGAALLLDAYREGGMQDEFEAVKDEYEDFKRFLVDYADRIPRLMGKRIDAIEKKIRTKFPQVRHIDIEIN